MSNYGTERRQLISDDPRQILTPADLKRNQEIAVLSIMKGESRGKRLAQAAVSLAGILGDQSNGRINAAKAGWQYTGPVGVAPLFRGTVEKRTDQGVWIVVNAEPTDPSMRSELVETEIEDLPPVKETYTRHMDYASLGLMAISAPNRPYGDPGLTPHNAGRWEPIVTIDLS